MKEWVKWLIYGFFFGWCFPLGALLIDYFLLNNKSMSIRELIEANPLHWIILLAPWVLGSVGSLIGMGRDRLKNLINNLQALNQALEGTTVDQQSRIESVMDELSHYAIQIQSINDNVNAGICLIDSDFNIEVGFNKGFSGIFGEQNYRNKSIFDTVFQYLEPTIKENMKQYLDILFYNTMTSDSMLKSANPIENFVYYNIHQTDKSMEKHISVDMARIKNKQEQVTQVMLIFNDITQNKLLEDQLKMEQETFQTDMELITSLLNCELEAVINFNMQTKKKISHIESLCNQIAFNKVNVDICQTIQEDVHSIKGESVSMGFQSLTKEAKDFENFLKEHKALPMDTENITALKLHQENLKSHFIKLHETIEKLDKFASSERGPIGDGSVPIPREMYDSLTNTLAQMSSDENIQNIHKKLQSFIRKSINQLEKEVVAINARTAEEIRKKSKIHFESNVNDLQEDQYILLKEMFIHLVRNSLAHGIESPEERVISGKDETGTIKIQIDKKDNRYRMCFADDGQGIDLESVKEKLISSGKHSPEEVAAMSKQQIINFIFSHGFSTNDKADDVSGLGVGMPVVRKNIKLLNGNMKLSNQPGKGLKLLFEFPG